MQFGFRFPILLFTTSVRFSTKTLAYLAYKASKAFTAFKRSRLNPFQNYRSITSFSVDWPRTIRLVYASVSILGVRAIILQVIAIQSDWQKNFMGKNLVVRHVTRPCPCMTTWSACVHLIGSQFVVMVLRAQWPLGTNAQFFILWRRKKKPKKQRHFMTGLPQVT